MPGVGQVVRRFQQGLVVGQGAPERLHDGPRRDRRQRTRARLRVEVDAAAAQLERVDRVVGQDVAHPGGEHDRRHQRQDDRVLAGELEQDDHRRDRGPGGAGEHRAHPDQAVGADRPGQPGHRVVQDDAVGRAEHRADEQAGREHAARAADADGQAGGEHLADQQHEQEVQRVVPAHAAAEHRVADAVHLAEARAAAARGRCRRRPGAATPASARAGRRRPRRSRARG